MNINDDHYIIYDSNILELQEWITYCGNPYNKLFHVGFKFQIIDEMGKCSQLILMTKW